MATNPPGYTRKAMRLWRAANPEAEAKRKAGEVAKRLARKEALAGRPKPPRCDACGEMRGRICWDHNHETGQFRGWLCDPCNRALGCVADNPDILRKLAAYLEN